MSESAICFVCLVCSADAIAVICERFQRTTLFVALLFGSTQRTHVPDTPLSLWIGVKVVTGAVDPHVFPGIGDFLERYHRPF